MNKIKLENEYIDIENQLWDDFTDELTASLLALQKIMERINIQRARAKKTLGE